MHLESLAAHSVKLDGTAISFSKGETIHTENSYKYAIDEVRSLAARAGFHSAQIWTDSNNLFGVFYLTVVG